MIYCLTSNAGSSGTFSHRSEFLRRLPVWNLFANYFPMRLHKSAELPPTRKYIFGSVLFVFLHNYNGANFYSIAITLMVSCTYTPLDSQNPWSFNSMAPSYHFFRLYQPSHRSMGAFAAFSTEALGFSKLFPGIKNSLLTLDSNFQIPIYRDYVLAMGLASVSKISMMNILSKGGVNKVLTT